MTFYYWPWYKKNDNDGIKTGQYKPSELYVDMKWATFKKEILEYGHINKWEYNNLIIPKAKAYLKTALCKSVLITYNPHLHYDIETTKLTRDNLIALMLYTDFAKLSKEFASTFRQIRLNESLQSIKSRNQKFWWMSKILRETVQCFGDNGSPSGQVLKGPFYVSYYRAIYMPEFNLRLNSPVSVSKSLGVVTRFMDTAKDSSGIVLILNNSGDCDSSRYLRSFNLR